MWNRKNIKDKYQVITIDTGQNSTYDTFCKIKSVKCRTQPAFVTVYIRRLMMFAPELNAGISFGYGFNAAWVDGCLYVQYIHFLNK